MDFMKQNNGETGEPPAKKYKTELMSLEEAHKSSARIAKKTEKLMKAFKSLLESTPRSFDVNEDFVPDPRVDLAVTLKRMYTEGEMAWIDDEMYDPQNSIQVQSETDSHWEHEVPSLLPLSTIMQRMSTSSSISSYNQSYKWPPDLPLIKNPVIAKRIFLHKSLAHERKKTSASDAHDYERLEFLGDSFINHTMTKLVYLNFPNCREGEMTLLRIHLISNITLSSWAKLYDFDKRLKVSESAAKSTNVLVSPKVLADCFEAYVAGLLHDSEEGALTAENWLANLANPTLRNILATEMKIALIDKQAKNKLYDYIGSSSRRPEYITLSGDESTGYVVSCQLNGEELSRGWATNVKDAGVRAAMGVLHNPKTVEKLRRLKVAQIRNINSS